MNTNMKGMKLGDLIEIEWIDDECLSDNKRTKSVGWIMAKHHDHICLTGEKYVAGDELYGNPVTIHKYAIFQWRLLERVKLPREVEMPDTQEDFETVKVRLSNGVKEVGFRFADGVYFKYDGKWYLMA